MGTPPIPASGIDRFDDQLCLFFRYLTPKEWHRAAQVCHKWHRFCQEPSVKDPIMLEKYRRINSRLLQASPLFSWIEKSDRHIYPFQFVAIHSRLVGVSVRYHNLPLKVHQLSVGFPFYCQLNERLLARSKNTLFFSSQGEKSDDRLIFRDYDLKEMTSVSLAEELPVRDVFACKVLECFPVTDTEFITISHGVIARWEITSNKLHRKATLQLFTQACEHYRQIKSAFRVKDFIFFNTDGEIDRSVIELESAKYRTENNTIGLDVKKFILFDPQVNVGRLASATSDFLYSYQLGKWKGYRVEDAGTDLNKTPALIFRWEREEDSRKGINDRWRITKKEEVGRFVVNIWNAKDGTQFFHVEIPLQIPEDHPNHLQRDLLFYRNGCYLTGDLLTVSFGAKIWLWHIPTKKQIGAFNLRNFFYVEESKSAVEDILLNENSLLILISHERAPSIKYQILSVPYSNLPQPPIEEGAIAPAAAAPIPSRGRYYWLRPSFWWGLIVSGFSYVLRFFH